MAMKSKAQNFDKCCRTCLSDVSEDMYDIFQERPELISIAELLSSYTTIQVDVQDRLPKKLCKSCYDCLLSFYKFMKTATMIDSMLREHCNKTMNSDEDAVQSTVFQIKIENDYSQCQDKNDNFDNSNDSVMAVKQEVMPYNISAIYSDISDASQLEDYAENHQPKELKCDICDRMFNTMMKLESHKQKHTHKYVCNICSQSFRYNYKYVEHLVKHRQDSQTKSYMTEINHNSDQRLQCEVCLANFKSVNSLSAHKRKHTAKDRVLSCSECNKIFKKISHLKRHELCHDNNRPFKCSLCPKSFTTEATLVEHVNKHNGIKPHCCPICSKSFAHSSTLTTHMKIHTREKPYLCPTCGKRFDASNNLNQHMKRHAGLKLFACTLCPRKFVSKGELKSHGITHTGEKSYSCDQCNATFTKRSSMGKHKLRHLGIKPYQCESCPMKFTSKDHLKRHNRIHTGERPYRCDICDRAFTQSNDLVKHTRSHLGNNLYKCSQCTQSFRLKTELRQHISEHFISSHLEALKMTYNDKPQALNDENDVRLASIPQQHGVIPEIIDKTRQ